MKTNKLLIFTLFCLVCFSACKKTTEIKGDVFIVTQGAGNYKLGLVQIVAIPETKIKSLIDTKKTEIAALKTELQKAAAKVESDSNVVQKGYDSGLYDNRFNADTTRVKLANSVNEVKEIKSKIDSTIGADFFAHLPAAESVATTDADGKFTLKLPKSGKYVLAARAERKVVDETEFYYWTILVDADGESKNIILSNNNTTDSASADSVFYK